jgi:hypothetical protein
MDVLLLFVWNWNWNWIWVSLLFSDAVSCSSLILTLSIDYFKPEPIINFARFHKIFAFITPAQREVAYKVWTDMDVIDC